jgi:WD40 repeat protein
LVGQLQLRGNTLVTGGSDGSVRVWSLEKMCPIHRLAAHDNSVTSLQFDDTRVVSGGSDGRVKVWDVKTGHLVRELVTAESVWRVVFEDEKCVAVTTRGSRVMMEVCDTNPEFFVASNCFRCGLSPHQRMLTTTGQPRCLRSWLSRHHPVLCQPISDDLPSC